MKAFIILALVAAASADVSHLRNVPRAAPSGGPDAQAEVLQQESDVRPDGFESSYQTSNGISAQEQGQLKGTGENAAIAVQGSYQYTANDGTPVELSYIADENGYQPQGAHLPTPPPPQPIPEYIVRALKYIEAHPPPPEGPQTQRRF